MPERAVSSEVIKVVAPAVAALDKNVAITSGQSASSAHHNGDVFIEE